MENKQLEELSYRYALGEVMADFTLNGRTHTEFVEEMDEGRVSDDDYVPCEAYEMCDAEDLCPVVRRLAHVFRLFYQEAREQGI